MANSTIEYREAPEASKPKDADSESMALSISERILLSWVWATGLGLFAAAFVWCCFNNPTTSLTTFSYVAAMGALTAALGRAGYSIVSFFLIIVLAIFASATWFVSAHIFSISTIGFTASCIALAVLGWRRKYWAYPLVICTIALAYGFGSIYAMQKQRPISAMRMAFPPQNLSKRLAYEKGEIKRDYYWHKDDENDIDGKVEGSDWDLIDSKWGIDGIRYGRDRNLQRLHDEATKQFIMMPDFGVRRLTPRIEPMEKTGSKIYHSNHLQAFGHSRPINVGALLKNYIGTICIARSIPGSILVFHSSLMP